MGLKSYVATRATLVVKELRHKIHHNLGYWEVLKAFEFCKWLINMAPEVGLEPTTLRLTAECSAIELLRSVLERGNPRTALS